MLALSGAKSNPKPFSQWMGKLDIRIKVLTMFVLSLSLIFLKNPVGLAFLGVLSTICLFSLGKYRLMGIIYLILVITWMLSQGFTMLLGLFVPAMKEQTVLQTIIPFLRMWPLINMALTVALSMEIGGALIALKKMRLPRLIYLPVMVALRFIPGFINDMKQLRDCLLIRGISLNLLALISHPNRTLRLLVVPMVIRALRLADELAIAAELKRVGYGEGLKTEKARLRWCDSTFFVAAMLALVVAWNIPGYEVESGMMSSINKPQTQGHMESGQQ
ncbi:energy-coupling factor transport system permease protein [Desulfuromusa kysingii]|uniref:Energy-coupling factor transport system permease protein n=1 Tax=Desulfuromusa kysingii TaxID=37625 RepID=A0A1H3VS87_9BACT|nr:energy-coupling factor transporter transmembrane component T [Desulfuromusa kysingii]SDZ77637.1 energy-coupling factor transport system permease protein [Desulfuromusa kysingii]